MNYELIDEGKHEFQNEKGDLITFDAIPVLIRNGLIKANEEVMRITINGASVGLLSTEQFLKVYEFSSKDG